jgi:hypothetical protein
MGDSPWTIEDVTRLLRALEKRTLEGAVEWETRGANGEARSYISSHGGVVLLRSEGALLVGLVDSEGEVVETYGYDDDGPGSFDGPAPIGEIARRLWAELMKDDNMVLLMLDELEAL